MKQLCLVLNFVVVSQMLGQVYGVCKIITMSWTWYSDLSLYLQTTKIEFLASRVRFNPKHFSNLTLFTENATIHADIMVVKPLRQGFKANVEFKLRLNNSKTHQKLFNHVLDVCDMLVGLRKTIFRKWFESILKYSNFMQNCPIPEGHYHLRDWRPDASIIPAYLFAGDYRIRGYCFYGNYKKKNMEFLIDMEVDAVIS